MNRKIKKNIDQGRFVVWEREGKYHQEDVQDMESKHISSTDSSIYPCIVGYKKKPEKSQDFSGRRK